VRAGDYTLVDKTYAELVHRLASRQANGIAPPPAILSDVTAFYANASAPVETRRHKRDWAQLQRELNRLQPPR
jgi:hypothetical protein